MPGDRLVIVLVVDGLRPDSITPEDTPTLHRLRAEGVAFSDSHSVFPTVTRVNAATLATGAQPGRTGIVGNRMYVPAVDPRRAFDTGDYRNLSRLDEATGGRVLLVPTLAERLHARGMRLVAVGSGSTGSSFLLNPKAPAGIGMVVNGYFDPGKTVAYPAETSGTILARFGPAPAKGGSRYDASVTWTQQVLREWVLPELRPHVVINWVTEPDHSQHGIGVGSPPTREALRHDDREIARVLDAVEALGLAGVTDVLVASDHGFTSNTGGVDVAQELVAAGLKDTLDSTDVVLASSGQAVGLYVDARDPGRIDRLARFVQTREWGGVVFTDALGEGDPRGVVDGTFALPLIHVTGERRPDVLFTFPWSSRTNAHGVPGSDLACVSGGSKLYASDHGSMSPWNVRNTLFAWGPSFKTRTTVGLPAGNADVAPTVLALLGLDGEEGLDGRVLREALADGPDPEQVAAETRVHTVATGAYRAAIQVSEVDGRRYADKSWRIT